MPPKGSREPRKRLEQRREGQGEEGRGGGCESSKEAAAADQGWRKWPAPARRAGEEEVGPREKCAGASGRRAAGGTAREAGRRQARMLRLKAPEL